MMAPDNLAKIVTAVQDELVAASALAQLHGMRRLQAQLLAAADHLSAALDKLDSVDNDKYDALITRG